MEKQFTLSVATPCSKKWNDFTPTSTGGFCHSCNENVIDFTKMSDHEILKVIGDSKNRTCGRFRPDQLKIHSSKTVSTTHYRLKYLYASSLSLLLTLGGIQSFAQGPMAMTETEAVLLKNDKNIKGKVLVLGSIVKGVVLDENKEPLPSVNVYLKDTQIGTTSDLEGRFVFPRELKAGDILVFRFLGYSPKEYIVTEEAEANIEIQLAFDVVEMLGEVAVDGPYTEEASPSRVGSWWQKIKQSF